MTLDWPYPGARWWKFDFHTHTPASTDTPWFELIGNPGELTPETWLLKYMAAEIDCVAITDHNSGAWIDKLKTAYVEMRLNPPDGFRELHIFPGVEISVNGGFHLLAIFDTSTTTRDIDKLLGKVDYSGTHGSSDGVTRKSSIETIQAILDADGLAIPAHADEKKGLLQLVDGTGKAALDALTLEQILTITGLSAIEVIDVHAQKPDIYTQKDLNWSQVLGSDCHNFRGDAVPGSRFTWIKMATPSLEGLRLALLDGQGVSVRRSDDGDFNPFNKPEHFIESIEINEARVMGRRTPAVLRFNPYFNVLVGGRGTGKSTVVHAMRLTYRRETDLNENSDPAKTFKDFNQVAKSRTDKGGLLAETCFILTVNRDGVLYRLHWRQNGQDPVVEESSVTPDEWQTSSSQEITQQRFPISLFSQGQIAALAGDSQQALLAVIDAAADTADVKQAFEDAKLTYFATQAKKRELKGKLKGRDALNVSLQDVQRKLQRFEASHHAEILKTYQRTNRQLREVERQFENVVKAAQHLRAQANEIFVEDLPEGLFDPIQDAEALEVMQCLAEAIVKAKLKVERVAEELSAASHTLKDRLIQGDWQKQVDQSKIAYEALKADLQTQGVNDPSEYGRLVQEQQRLDTDVKYLDALQKQHDELNEQVKLQHLSVLEARRAISYKRREFLHRTLKDNPYVQIALRPYGCDPSTLERLLRETLGTDKFKDDIYVDSPPKGILSDLMQADNKSDGFNDGFNESALVEFEDKLKSVQKRFFKACCGNGDFSAKFNNFLVSEASKKAEYVDHIFCWFPEDGLQIKYSRKGDGKGFIPIGQASAGQRAAAMLAFLLAYGHEPLVLDQPEDDLDNHLIYDLVVQQIRANKQQRQLIIVTHNPNIVVNGDAEMIHALEFNHQCYIKQSGSLQDKQMRDEICTVMEGGADAFKRRYQRLGKKA